MLKHVVLFKFKAEVPDSDLDAWVVTLQQLVNQIGVIRLWEVGRELTGRSGPNAEVCLISGFDSAADLEAYDKHPAHVQVVTDARRMCSSITRTNFWAS